MSSKRSFRKRTLSTPSLRPEGEPGSYFDSADLGDGRDRRHERKTRQLCEQVGEALSLALAECRDPSLANLFVETVDPAPNASRLRVALSAEAGASAPAILEALDRAHGHLRRHVAAAIHRKRTPELSFVLVAPEARS